MTPDTLLAGPRGRRVLLEFVLLSEEAAAEARRPAEKLLPLRSAVVKAAHHLGEQTGMVYMSFSSSAGSGHTDGDDTTDLTDISNGSYGRDYPEVMPPDVVACLIRETPLAEPTPELLEAALDISVGAAMYWQPPHGEDVLASSPVVVAALQDAAEVVAASPHVLWWDAPLIQDALDDQWTVSWSDQPGSPATGISVCPAQHRGSNEWWSFPDGHSGSTASGDGTALLSSTRSLTDGSPSPDSHTGDSRELPAGLMFVEDVYSDSAWVRALHIPRDGEDGTDGADGTIVEITGPDDWAAISRHYDGVHLTVACYLAATTQAIFLDDRTASVIAGWGPDRTYWFAPVREDATATRWARDDERRWRSTSS